MGNYKNCYFVIKPSCCPPVGVTLFTFINLDSKLDSNWTQTRPKLDLNLSSTGQKTEMKMNYTWNKTGQER